MYKVTLQDYNCSPIADGTVSFFAEDIEVFQKRWFALLGDDDDSRKERFLRSKAGEFVTDDCSDSPELNIVQQDEESLFAEKHIVLEKVTFEAFNAYGWPTQYHVNQWILRFRWIAFLEKFYGIAFYRANGVCEYSDFADRWKSVECYGNPVLENVVAYNPRYNNRVDPSEWPAPGFDAFLENRLETICWLTSACFASEQAMKDDLSSFEVSKEIMNQLFADVVGEAG